MFTYLFIIPRVVTIHFLLKTENIENGKKGLAARLPRAWTEASARFFTSA